MIDRVAAGWNADHDLRWIEVGDLRLEEDAEGAHVIVKVERDPPWLSSTELAGLARHLSGWFADDPSEAIQHVEKCAAYVRAELETWNDRARRDEEHPPYDELTRSLDAISDTCRRLRDHAIFGRRPEKTDLSLLQDAGAKDHPAYEAFCRQLRGRAYGSEAMNQAWVFFKKGWDGK